MRQLRRPEVGLPARASARGLLGQQDAPRPQGSDFAFKRTVSPSPRGEGVRHELETAAIGAGDR